MKVFSQLCGFVLIIVLSCSQADEPAPVDCSKSGLILTLTEEKDPTSCVAFDGAITLGVTGGVEPYSFSINGGTKTSNPVFAELGPGSYVAVVTDKNGCEEQVIATLSLPPGGLQAQVQSIISDTDCLGNNGSATVVATGGTPPYQYKIGSGLYTDVNTFANLAFGSVSFFVKDAAGCEVSVAASIPRGNTGTTYVADVKPIFQSKCDGANCHPDNLDLYTYSVAFSRRSAIKSEVQSGKMPPASSPDLTEAEKSLIICWVDDGAHQN
jgi:hypothetical protein